MGLYDHPVRERRRAGGYWVRLSTNIDDAKTARSSGGETVVMAQVRDVYTSALKRREHGRTRFELRALAVQLYVHVKPCGLSAGDMPTEFLRDPAHVMA